MALRKFRIYFVNCKDTMVEIWTQAYKTKTRFFLTTEQFEKFKETAEAKSDNELIGLKVFERTVGIKHEYSVIPKDAEVVLAYKYHDGTIGVVPQDTEVVIAYKDPDGACHELEFFSD